MPIATQQESLQNSRTVVLSLFIYMVAFLILCLLSSITMGEDTFSSQPSYHSATDHYYDTLYMTDFDSINDFKKSESGFGQYEGYITCQNGNVEIKSVNGETHYIESRRIDYYEYNFLTDGMSYEVWFEFKRADEAQNKFTVFNNGEINLYVGKSGTSDSMLYRQCESSGEEPVQILNANQWYFFWIRAFHQENYNVYELIISGSNKGACVYTNSPATQTVFFGSDDTGHWGRGYWNLLQLNGWSITQYFNNFNDDSCHEFRLISYDHAKAPCLVGNWAEVKVNNDALYFDTYYNNPMGGGTAYNGYIYTEYINYEPIESWRISLDFKILSSNNAFFILVKNRQATIVIDGMNLYYYTNQLNLVKNLQTDTWYFLELEKTSSLTYKILIDNDEEETGCTFESNTQSEWWDYLGIGDWGQIDYADGIYIDNLKLIVEDRTHSDYDSDTLGDDFEYDGDTEKIYVWSTDFEDRNSGNVLDLEELGWDFEDELNGPDDETIWERGEITYEDPFSQYDTPETGHAEGIHPGSNGKVLGTNLDGLYSNCFDVVITPKISTVNVLGGLRITFWHWYNTEEGEQGDGGQIYISTDGGGSWNLLGNYGSPYNTEEVDVLNDGPGFTGNSGDWVYVVIDCDSTYVGPGKNIRLAFLFAADNDENVGSGWFIDDIKIFGNMNKISSDTDSDSLNDFEEFHKYCSSPFISDTDGDSLSDYNEVKQQALATWEFYVNYLDEYNSWSDPLTKDIWVEVDEMESAPGDPYYREWSYNDYEVREIVTDCFLEHEINIHFVYSEDDIEVIENATSEELEDIALLESDSGHREDDHNYLYHYLLWAHTNVENYYLGEAYASHWYMVVYAKQQSLDSSQKRAKVLMFTLGLNLGLWCYNGDYYDEESNNPPDTSMKLGVGTWIDFLDEESDWIYEVQSGDPPYDEQILGGWEYAHTDEAEFIRGLDYSGILKDKDFNDTGWHY